MKLKDMQKLEWTESKMLQWMCAVSQKESKPTVMLWKSLGVVDVSDMVRRAGLSGLDMLNVKTQGPTAQTFDDIYKFNWHLSQTKILQMILNCVRARELEDLGHFIAF